MHKSEVFQKKEEAIKKSKRDCYE